MLKICFRIFNIRISLAQDTLLHCSRHVKGKLSFTGHKVNNGGILLKRHLHSWRFYPTQRRMLYTCDLSRKQWAQRGLSSFKRPNKLFIGSPKSFVLTQLQKLLTPRPVVQRQVCVCSLELPRAPALANRARHYINSLHEALDCSVSVQRNRGSHLPLRAYATTYSSSYLSRRHLRHGRDSCDHIMI